MEGREDVGVGLVLEVREGGADVGDVVVVEQGHGAYDLAVVGPLLVDEGGAHEVAEGLAARLILSLGDEGVEAREEVLLKGHADADDLPVVVG